MSCETRERRIVCSSYRYIARRQATKKKMSNFVQLADAWSRQTGKKRDDERIKWMNDNNKYIFLFDETSSTAHEWSAYCTCNEAYSTWATRGEHGFGVEPELDCVYLLQTGFKLYADNTLQKFCEKTCVHFWKKIFGFEFWNGSKWQLGEDWRW